MNRCTKKHAVSRLMLSLVLAVGFTMPLSALAASVALATSPLATSTTSTVKPNLLFILDNSGSMDWDHMPDDKDDAGSSVSWVFGYYGYRSAQCNQVYYDETITYLPPVDATGASYSDASFTAAWKNGFNTGAGSVNLNTSFRASQSRGGDTADFNAYYYVYSGAQLTQLQKNYNKTTNAFYKECNSSVSSDVSKMPPVREVNALDGLTNNATGVFSKRRLSTAETTTITVSGSSPTTTSVSSIKVNGVELMSGASGTSTSTNTVAANIAAKITLGGYSATVSGSVVTITGPTSAANYTPVITKTGSMTLTPDVFPDTTAAKLTNFANWYSYYRTRMLMMKTASGRAFSSLSNNYRVGLLKISSSTLVRNLGTFETTHRADWYDSLYGMVTDGSTPLRTALSNAGRHYAGKLGADPVQYSCQQNFSILSTDGYWNAGDGFMIDGSSAVGNQDGTAARPQYDGAVASSTWTFTYTRNDYSTTTSGCSSGKKKLKTQPQMGSCTAATSTAGCTPSSWSNSGVSYTTGSCVSSPTIPSPDPSSPVQLGSPVVTTTGGSSDNLADIAMYYYQTDLRTTALGNCDNAGTDVCENNVFIGGNDSNTQQHMTTFTLGLGASGWMNYSSSYLSDTSGDFYSVKLGSTADNTVSPPVCPWQSNGTVCNWPLPGMSGSDGLIANIDDLWHAAVNGHGAYFSATNPSSLSSGLSNALAGINARKGAAAAAATSTLNPVAGNNYAYVASYTTVKWQGNLEARGINVDTGAVNENASWCVESVVAGDCVSPGAVVADTSGETTSYYCVTPNSIICTGGIMDDTDCKVPVATSCTGTMKTKVADVSDTRAIYTSNTAGTALTPFDSAYATAYPANFAAAHISTLGQWASLTSTQRTAAEGVNLINFLRGQYGFEDRTANNVDDRLYRYRETVLGDALESQPAYISAPLFHYPYPGYSEFVTAQAGRLGTVYMGTNDGMMHAFAADTGVERWAYVPTMVIPDMWKLADVNYATLHANYVNGSAVTTDICSANCSDAVSAVWKTILVAGLNGGGRGYYALDITDPSVPVLLWEFTTTTGSGVVQDDDLGYSFGSPIVTQKADGTWVVIVTSGYNNTSPGDGKGYLYVLNANTGTKISKISTGVGSTATPSGLAKISGWNDEAEGNKVGYVYGGDLLGNVWRFDVNSAATASYGTGDVLKFATLFSDAGGTNSQPITTTPVLGKIADKRVVFVGTGKYLEKSDLSTTQTQTQYAIKDDAATSTFVNPRNTLVEQTLTANPDGTATRLGSKNAVNFYTGRGWYIDFPDSGERVNIDSKLVQGTLLIPTIIPSNTVCSPGGYGWLNYVDYKTGGALNTDASLKYDATIVGINIIYIDGAPKVGVVTSSNPTPDITDKVDFTDTSTGYSGKRVIWRELIP